MKLYILFILIIPMLFMVVAIYLSPPAKRRFWTGCTFSVLGIVIFLWAAATHYDHYHISQIGVIPYHEKLTFWEDKHAMIWLAIFTFVKGIIFMIIGWLFPDKESFTQSASKSQ